MTMELLCVESLIMSASTKPYKVVPHLPITGCGPLSSGAFPTGVAGAGGRVVATSGTGAADGGAAGGGAAAGEAGGVTPDGGVGAA